MPNPDDRVPDLFIDGQWQRPRQAGETQAGRGIGAYDTKHRKLIRGFSWLAWIVVLGLTGFLLFGNIMSQQEQKVAEMSKGELLQPIYAGKFAVGMRKLSDTPGLEPFGEQAADFVKTLDSGPIEQRFCHSIALNEFEGVDEALARLERLREQVAKIDLEYNETQVRLESILKNIFKNVKTETPPQVSDSDAEFLKDKLAWFGDLALNTEASKSPGREALIGRAETSVMMAMSAVIVGILMLLLGCVLFFVFSAKLFGSGLKHRVVDNSRYGPVYIETFAIWMLLFLGVSLAVALQGRGGMEISVTAMVMLVPLSALIWPVIRGVPNSDLMDDIGLRVGNPLVEIGAGIVGYLAMMPVIFAGAIASVIVMLVMSLLQGPGSHEFAPTGVPHPIANEAFGGDLVSVMVTIFFIASVLAPITEEIMFRGVLYRHLRDASHRMARWGSIIFAALVSSLVFAAIHPQGLAGIPVLTTLAVGFCLVRQWRGSLVAPMTMHAIHNGIATSMLIPLIY